MSGWPRRRNEIRSRGRGHGRQRDKGSVVEVHFQTAHFGWNTDDLLVVGLRPATSQFWFLWRMFADKGRDARWLTRIDAENAQGREMIAAIFLGSWWKADVRHWRSLEGYADHVHSLFEGLPVSSTGFGDYVRFLYHIGEQSLPGAFIRIAQRLQQGEPEAMLRDGRAARAFDCLHAVYMTSATETS